MGMRRRELFLLAAAAVSAVAFAVAASLILLSLRRPRRRNPPPIATNPPAAAAALERHERLRQSAAQPALARALPEESRLQREQQRDDGRGRGGGTRRLPVEEPGRVRGPAQGEGRGKRGEPEGLVRMGGLEGGGEGRGRGKRRRHGVRVFGKSRISRAARGCSKMMGILLNIRHRLRESARVLPRFRFSRSLTMLRMQKMLESLPGARRDDRSRLCTDPARAREEPAMVNNAANKVKSSAHDDRPLLAASAAPA